MTKPKELQKQMYEQRFKQGAEPGMSDKSKRIAKGKPRASKDANGPNSDESNVSSDAFPAAEVSCR